MHPIPNTPGQLGIGQKRQVCRRFDLPKRDGNSGETTLRNRADLALSGIAAVLALAFIAAGTPTCVLAEDGSVRIGYLTDVGGPSSSNDGTAGVDAARMAIEDVGGS